MELEIATVLRTARAAKELTQQQVADTLGVSRAAVGQWESGVTKPTYLNLVALFNLYDLMLPKTPEQEARKEKDIEELSKHLRKPAIRSPSGNYTVPVRMMVSGEFGMCVETPKPLYYVFKPPIENDTRELFAVEMYVETLWPRFERGDILYLETNASLIVGCYAILSYILEDVPLLPPAPFIRRINAMTNDTIEVEQFKPATRKVLKSGEFEVIGRVLHPRELYPLR